MRIINADQMIANTERMKQVADAIEIDGIIKYINENAIEEYELREFVDEMSSYFPCCIGCEGKTTTGERTEKCVYALTDPMTNVDYCIKRGIENIAKLTNNVKEAEWIPTKDTYGCGGGDYGFKCSNCKARVRRKDVINKTHTYCYRCGAKMKEYKWVPREKDSPKEVFIHIEGVQVDEKES